MVKQDVLPLVLADALQGYWRRFLLVAAVALILVFALLFPFPWDTRASGEVFNVAHAPSFLAVFFLVVGILDPSSIGFPASWHRIVGLSVPRLFLIAGVLLGVGVTCEILQQFVGRSPSFSDILSNGCGVVAGLLWCVRCKSTGTTVRIGCLVLSTGLLVGVSWSPIAELYECYLQDQEIPLLASFERPRELNVWMAHESKISRTSSWKTDRAHSMQVRGVAGTFHPGANFYWPKVNCNNYTSVELDVYNPGDEHLTLRINISDGKHAASGFDPNDRYKTAFEIPPTESVHIKIKLSDVEKAPAKRLLNLQNLAHMNLFIVQPTSDFVFMVDNVRLINDTEDAP